MKRVLWTLLVSLLSTFIPKCVLSSASEAAALRMLHLSDDFRLSLTGKEDGESSGESRLPFITVSYAQTIDGSIAPLNRTRLDISSKTSFQLLHSLRATHDGVLVGINTVLCDQPQLNVRNPLSGVTIPKQQPKSLIIDTDLRILEVSDNLLLQEPIVFTCVSEDEEDERHDKGEIFKSAIETRDENGPKERNSHSKVLGARGEMEKSPA